MNENPILLVKTGSRGLWRIYVFIVAASLLLGATVLFLQWKNVVRHATTELEYTNQLIATSQLVVMRKYETMLALLGEGMLSAGGLQGKASAQQRLDSLLKKNPELAAFGLADTKGKLVLTTFNIDRSRLPNLLQNPRTAKSFRQALHSDHMVIGRTYFMRALKQWVIPLRFRLRNSKGKITGVMTTGLKLDSSQSVWSPRTLPQHIHFSIVRDDYYHQYGSFIRASERNSYYGKPVRKRVFDYFSRKLKEKTGLSLDAAKKNSVNLSLYAPDFRGDLDLAVVSYEPRYESYIITRIPMPILIGRFSVHAGWTIFLILLLDGVLFLVFRSHNRQQGQAEKQLSYMACHDQLTGLSNRYYLAEGFTDWQGQQGSTNSFSVLFIDLDNFKGINDLHGHNVGDAILQEVATRLINSFPGSFQVRQGGDEFIVLYRGLFTRDLDRACRRFLATLGQPIHHEDLQFVIRASVGVAQSPTDGVNLDELLRKADMAMYEAKRLHNGIYVYTEQLEHKRKRAGHIEGALVHALENNEFSLAYQPQIDAETGRIIGAEALLRWHSGKMGQISPVEFIPVAESMGMMTELGKFVVMKVLDEAPVLSENYSYSDQAFRLAINASVSQLLDTGFVEYLVTQFKQGNCDKLAVVIEITESLFIEDVDYARDILEGLKREGLEISLDDFGTGYSSLSLLSKLPISELKIDREFVKDILNDEQDYQLIRSIIGLGNCLGIPVLAEGVEYAEQARRLSASGCNRFQGYFYAKPMNSEDLAAFLKNWVELSPEILDLDRGR